MSKLVRTLLQKSEKGTKTLIRWLQKKKLLAQKMRCPFCQHRMKICKTITTKDGYRWRCRRSGHGSVSRSIRRGSIFERSHLSLSGWMKIMHSLAQGLRRRHVDMIEDGVCGSSSTITKITTIIRKTCVKAMKRLERNRKMKIGGRRAFIAIDESKFQHKRKYARGRFGRTWHRRHSWVFGLLEVKGDSRRPVLRMVRQRSRRCLLPIIRKYVKRRSQVLSDSWRAYHTLAQEGYIHYQVNHSRFFVHPQTGAHTQHIERAWRTYKETIYRYRGNLTKKALKMNLRFIEWNYWLAKDHRHGTLGRLFHDIRASFKV